MQQYSSIRLAAVGATHDKLSACGRRACAARPGVLHGGRATWRNVAQQYFFSRESLGAQALMRPMLPETR